MKVLLWPRLMSGRIIPSGKRARLNTGAGYSDRYGTRTQHSTGTRALYSSVDGNGVGSGAYSTTFGDGIGRKE